MEHSAWFLERMDLSTARRAGLALLSRKVPPTSVLRYFRRLLMNGHRVLGRLFGLGMLAGSVRMALLGGVRGSRFGRVRVMPWDGRMRALGSGDRSRQTQRNRTHPQLPDHEIIFGRESPEL